MESRSISSRGAKKIPNQWTRIIAMHDDHDKEMPTYSIAVDLQLAGLDNLVASAGSRKNWEPLFFTNNFLAGLGELKLEDFRLKDRHLR